VCRGLISGWGVEENQSQLPGNEHKKPPSCDTNMRVHTQTQGRWNEWLGLITPTLGYQCIYCINSCIYCIYDCVCVSQTGLSTSDHSKDVPTRVEPAGKAWSTRLWDGQFPIRLCVCVCVCVCVWFSTRASRTCMIKILTSIKIKQNIIIKYQLISIHHL